MTPETALETAAPAGREARPEPRLFVGSDVGVLPRVLLHRADAELKRLTPRNKDELLFDDVLWVKRARREHDSFADRGVEVLYLTIAGSELGRGGPRCMSCPIEREELS